MGCSDTMVDSNSESSPALKQSSQTENVKEENFLGKGGFDALGYNRGARIFNGAVDGTDGVLDGTYWGDPTYASDKLKMKWNAEWDRGNAEGWSDPNGYDAWIDNQWNENVPNGSGEIWHYKIKWVGACGVNGTPTGDGGYCLWGQFEVVMSNGNAGGEHF